MDFGQDANTTFDAYLLNTSFVWPLAVSSATSATLTLDDLHASVRLVTLTFDLHPDDVHSVSVNFDLYVFAPSAIPAFGSLTSQTFSDLAFDVCTAVPQMLSLLLVTLTLKMLGLSSEGRQASLNELEPCGDAASSASSPEIGESAGCS